MYTLELVAHTYPYRFLREELHIGFLRDALGSELTSQEISQREVSLDKELVQLIQLACKSDQHQRALDAAALLHHTQSFDMAIKVAAFYHLVGLQEKLTVLKDERMETDRLEEDREQRKAWGKHSTAITAPQNYTFESSNGRFEDFAPPPASIRKSLAPATPLVDNPCAGYDDMGSSSNWGPRDIVASVAAMRAETTNPGAYDGSFERDASFSSTVSGKRKRDTLDRSELDISADGDVSKKRALSPSGIPESISAKPTKSGIAISHSIFST